MTVEELREKLNLQNKYENFYDFRRRVLQQAKEDIEKHTNMRFTWTEIKARKGRKIERIMFDIQVSDPVQVELPFSPDKVDMSKHKKLQKTLARSASSPKKRAGKCLATSRTNLH